MASAMRKMAVYLGLVEDDHRYQDKYDSYGEYEDYEEQADRPEQIDEPDVRGRFCCHPRSPLRVSRHPPVRRACRARRTVRPGGSCCAV